MHVSLDRLAGLVACTIGVLAPFLVLLFPLVIRMH